MKKNELLENKIRLEHILKAIRDIEEYVYLQTATLFCENDRLNNAVLFQFSSISEAVHHVERNILSNYEYPWHKVCSFFNLIAHEYFNIQPTAV